MDNPDPDLPDDCEFSSDAYYIRYEYHGQFNYVIEVCMPGNRTQSPWKNERTRQDIHEELYLKMNFSGDYNVTYADPFKDYLQPIEPGIYAKKLTLDTTAGYFELPNYKNGGVPGPLISNDPWPGWPDSMSVQGRSTLPTQDNDTSNAILNLNHAMDRASNKGPLHNIAMSLFGEGSFADIEHTPLAAYMNSNASSINQDCIDIVPFLSLLRGPEGIEDITLYNQKCLTGSSLVSHLNDSNGDNIKILHATAAWYFWAFSGQHSAPYPRLIQNAFSSAAFLAIDTMMINIDLGGWLPAPTVDLCYDMGADLQIPSISLAGVIFVSILLAVDLLCLLALALYSSWIPRWTGQLDSFAMMRIGASISEKVPLLATDDPGRIQALDNTPGWMGNSSQNDIGGLCLGGERPLTKTKYYRGYETEPSNSRLKARKAFPKLTGRGEYSLANTRDE